MSDKPLKFSFFLIFLVIFSCEKSQISQPDSLIKNTEFISAVDISTYPEISGFDPVFYDLNGEPQKFLSILKENGVNTIRLRLWVNPKNNHSGLSEVRQFSKTLRDKGFKIWLTLHYSDTWADPGHQEIPLQWQGKGFPALKDSLYAYTEKVIRTISPEYIQIGNEINSGLLHPYGDISQNLEQFKELMKSGIAAVRKNSADTEIILHFAGIEGSDWFFDQVRRLDYDIIGISYYPVWHGKSLDHLHTHLNLLSETKGKKIVIAETAYPFTLSWNDWTNNIVGLEEQLILPEFPATANGQKAFIRALKQIIQEIEKGVGFCYWGAELIAWKGNQAKDGSDWENQALFDFQNRSLPVLLEF